MSGDGKNGRGGPSTPGARQNGAHAPYAQGERKDAEGTSARPEPFDSAQDRLREAESKGPLDVSATLRGRTILFTGATGFVGKVALSMLLHRYPDVGKVFVLVRPGTGGTAEARFFGKVAPSRPFDPLRERHGAGFDAFVRARCTPVAGDVSDPLLGLSEADRAAMAGLDLVVNCAGLVDFNPSLALALDVNVHGARNAVELCRATGAALVHVSTTFVAGNRSGVVFEDEPIAGYFPRQDGLADRPAAPPLDARDFDLERELADAAHSIALARAEADDAMLVSTLRARARERLLAEGREGDEKAERLALAREKRLWISQRLVELGMDRARHWGWPNTYTYTKSLGEQVIAASGVLSALVRPSIVETALRYPFPGWNEGFTTSAPLAFLGLKGQRVYPMGERAILDIVPVDLVAAGTIAVAAEVLERRAAGRGPAVKVYHLASSDTNPLYARRALELVGLYRRRFYKKREEGNRLVNLLLARVEPYPVSRAHYEAFSAPAFASLTRAASRLLREGAAAWGAPRASALAFGAAERLDELEAKLLQTKAIFDLFMPFVWDNRYVFSCANLRALRARLAPADAARLPWDPEAIAWRTYWLDVHMKGLEEWVFPGLEEDAKKKVHAPRQHRDLLELFHAACANHARRVALRMSGERKERFTYGDLRASADAVAGFLVAHGLAPGERVLLASENRPEWPIAFFGILLAGGVAVPVDAQLSAPELANLAKSAGAKVALLSDEVAERLRELVLGWEGGGVPRAVLLAEALTGERGRAPHRVPSPDEIASVIFTSGTTGTPKGVMLTHRNFTSLAAKLAGLFDLGPGDGLLSVLPLHHTFEFTCGLLVPLSRGAEVEYLDELTADTLGDALESGRVTALIGVPALWSLLHRRITQELAARPGFVEGAMKALMAGNARLRDELGLNLGKLVFWPVHRKLGGRLRILVSGGSALSPEVQQAFRELGFDLFEGYGLTEAAPVLAVSTPADAAARGTVGRPLPGIELRILDPDASGVGEVLARGPNVMAGYWKAGATKPEADPALTGAVLKDGWLSTGDLGRLDSEGRLTLVGRQKDVIIDADGKNAYPDELEELYRNDDLVKELSIVGLPDDARGERVAMAVVPAWGDGDRAQVRRRLDEHVRKVSAGLPFHKRVKLWHVVEGELPKTATRKVKRALVAVELRRLEAAAHKGERAREAALQGAPDGWLLDLVADVSRRPRAEVTHASHLAADLGFDSLMLTELAAALERAGVPPGATEELHQVQTVAELARAVVSASRRGAAEPRAEAKPPASQPRDLELPEPLAVLGKRLLGAGQRFLYREIYETKVRGAAFIPKDRNFIVVANHASHLDMGLVKVALGDQGVKLASLAARDYFFDTPLKRAYFGNLTNLIPMERSGSIRTSLRAATEALRRGMNLLMFPEGTRSRDGVLTEFKPTAGYLALECGVDTLPVYLHGTFDALPAGGLVPRRAKLEVAIGPPIAIAELRRRTAGLAKGDAHKEATRVMEEAVRKLAAGFATPTPTSTISVHPEPFDSAQDRLREAESKDSTPTPTFAPAPLPEVNGECPSVHPERSAAGAESKGPTLTTAHLLKAHKP